MLSTAGAAGFNQYTTYRGKLDPLEKARASIPGPSQYSQSVDRQSNMALKQSSRNFMNRTIMGTCILSSAKNSPAISIGLTKRWKKLELSPGPSDY